MSPKFRLPAIALLLLAPSIARAGEAASKWEAWIDGGAFYSNKSESRGESTLWVPLAQSPTSVFFFEGQGKLFEESQREGNLALAYRQMLANGWNLGAWGGYDIRSTSLGATFKQIAGGVEALSADWDFRFNGYLPLEDSEVVGESSQQFGGNPTILLNGSSILMQTGVISSTSKLSELAFGGVDAEIGLRLPVESLSINPQFVDLRVFGGGFYFDNPDADREIAGPKARAELRLNDIVGAGSRLTLEAAFTSDDIRGELYETGARLRIPLGGQQALSSMNLREQRMSEGLRRDTDIVASAKTETTNVNTLTTEAVADAATNVDLDKVAYVDATTAGGISGVSTAEGANTLIIADGGNGAFNANTVLQSAQTLLGGGGWITLVGKTSGTQVQFTAPGAAAAIVGQTGAYAVATGSNVHVTGFGIDATSATGGILAGPWAGNTLTQNVVIDHNTIDAGTNDAIATSSSLVGSSSIHVVIADNIIVSAANGINVFETSDIGIRNNDVSGITNVGVLIQSPVQDASITDNSITTAGNTIGIFIAGGSAANIDVVGNVISSQGAVFVAGTAGTGTISNNSFDTQGATAITLNGSNNAFNGAGNMLQNGSACGGGGSNPGTNVGFTDGSTCP